MVAEAPFLAIYGDIDEIVNPLYAEYVVNQSKNRLFLIK
jgi:hypothetical protein